MDQANSVSEASLKRGEVALPPRLAERELVVWQRRLLPFMTGFVVVMAGLFFVFSGLHLYHLSSFIETEHGVDIRALIESEMAKPTSDKLTSDVLAQHALLFLEAETLDKRYHQASALLISRIWSRQLAFITGMIMAFLGAVFILGKLSESPSEISGASGEWKLAITSASPGIILSFLGTVLLVCSLLVRASVDVSDGPAYVHLLKATGSNNTANPDQQRDQSRPIDLDEFHKLNQSKSGAVPSR